MPAAAPSPIAPPTDYNAQASNVLGGITPEKIQQLMASLNSQGKKAQFGAGIAGIGDAIASVGGQQPGHMRAAEENIQKNKELGMELPGKMAELGKERFGVSQALQEQDPASPLSKYAQDTYAPLGKRMGLDLSKASAKMIGDVVGKSVDQLKNEAQEAEAKAIHEQTAAYQGESLEALKEHQKAETQQGAARALEGRGTLQKVKDVFSPSPETKALQGQLPGSPPTINSQQELDQLPVGAKYIFNGIPHTKRSQ
jgi:hypothetical protein